MNIRQQAQEADAYEVDCCYGYNIAKRDYGRQKYFTNKFLPRTGAHAGYEAYREALRVAQEQGAAA